MKRKIGHSIKALTQQPGGALASLLRRGWGRLLVLAVLLLAANGYAYAQNSAGGPYLNSWHQYQVTMADAGNTVVWKIFNDATDAANDLGQSAPDIYELDVETWVQNIQVVAGEAYIEIYFDKTIFTADPSWFLVYSEMDGSSCVARRQFPITVVNNQFELSLTDLGDDCNSFDGTIFDNGYGTNGNISLVTNTSTVAFEIQMDKEDPFRPYSWEFSGTLSITAGSASNSLGATLFQATTGTTADGRTWTIDNISGGNFQLHVTGIPDDATNLDDAVTIVAQVDGDITQDYTLQLEINSGTAYSGSGSYTIATDDNLNGTSRTVERTMDGIPNTTVITVTP